MSLYINDGISSTCHEAMDPDEIHEPTKAELAAGKAAIKRERERMLREHIIKREKESKDGERLHKEQISKEYTKYVESLAKEQKAQTDSTTRAIHCRTDLESKILQKTMETLDDPRRSFYAKALRMVSSAEIISCRELDSSELLKLDSYGREMMPGRYRFKDKQGRPVKHYRLKKLYTLNGSKYVHEVNVMVQDPASVLEYYNGKSNAKLPVINRQLGCSLGHEVPGVFPTLNHAKRFVLLDNEVIEQNHANRVGHAIHRATDDDLSEVSSPEDENIYLKDILCFPPHPVSHVEKFLFVGAVKLDGVEHTILSPYMEFPAPNTTLHGAKLQFLACKLSKEQKSSLRENNYKKINLLKTHVNNVLRDRDYDSLWTGYTDIHSNEYHAYQE